MRAARRFHPEPVSRPRRLDAMPPRSEPAVTVSMRLRRLQRRLPELSVPALLRVRDALEPILASDRVRPRDVDDVIRAAGEE